MITKHEYRTKSYVKKQFTKLRFNGILCGGNFFDYFNTFTFKFTTDQYQLINPNFYGQNHEPNIVPEILQV
jgi:hypothetical protein